MNREIPILPILVLGPSWRLCSSSPSSELKAPLYLI
jgi:hypothetical protein